MSATVNTTASCAPSDGGGNADVATAKEEKASVRDDFETSAHHARVTSVFHIGLVFSSRCAMEFLKVT